MIKNNASFRILFIPIAIFALGCFIAYNATAEKSKEYPNRPTYWLWQDTSKIIQVIHADTTILEEKNNNSYTTLDGNVVLKQGKTLFKANKAVKNNTLNTFEAWGRVHINDADTTNIYSDHLLYFGNERTANLDGNVKLTDGQVTLTTPSLKYDMNTNIGTYNQGGKVINKKTIITSKEGEYYRDIQDLYFKKNVVVTDPAYNITSDSLQYNTGTQIATFITMTHIKDSARRSIDTKEGYYNLKTGQAEFAQRPFINDDNKSTLRADRVYLDSNIARAEGNAIATDSTRGTTIIANLIFQNRMNEAILATKKPLMIVKQDNGSIFIAADTLFSAKLSDLYETPPPQPLIPTIEDTLKQLTQKQPIKNSTTPILPSKNSLTKLSETHRDTVPKLPIQYDSSHNTTATQEPVASDETLEEDPVTPLSHVTKQDTIKPIIKKDAKTISANWARPKSKITDSTDRYFEAFHNVRVYSDSMQAVSDSLFYSFKDSTFRLYKKPVVWGKESQISGDTILLHTKNKQPFKMEAFKNGFMVNYISGEAYNQIKATRIDAYFRNGGLYSVRAKGTANCIYYLQDEDSSFTGVNKNTCDIIDSYFENKQLHKVAFRGNVEGTIYPIRQSNPSEMKLEGFIWREAERPKTKYELFE